MLPRSQAQRSYTRTAGRRSKASGAVEGMASKKTVIADNLAALGAERLATILVELADGDAEIKRRLRLELAA